eukprot:7976972-Pyramimonas_sp.AAC.1
MMRRSDTCRAQSNSRLPEYNASASHASNCFRTVSNTMLDFSPPVTGTNVNSTKVHIPLAT